MAFLGNIIMKITLKIGSYISVISTKTLVIQKDSHKWSNSTQMQQMETYLITRLFSQQNLSIRNLKMLNHMGWWMTNILSTA